MITQKIFKTGNSVAVTIPKQLLEELQLREGAEVVWKKKGKEAVLTPKKPTLVADVDPKFMQMVDEFVSEHEDVLKELSKR